LLHALSLSIIDTYRICNVTFCKFENLDYRNISLLFESVVIETLRDFAIKVLLKPFEANSLHLFIILSVIVVRAIMKPF